MCAGREAASSAHRQVLRVHPPAPACLPACQTALPHKQQQAVQTGAPPDHITASHPRLTAAPLAPRLSGDYNPLHIDPEVSRRVGFERPILHGLCSMGVSVRQVLLVFGGDDPASIRSIKVMMRGTRVWPGHSCDQGVSSMRRVLLAGCQLRDRLL